MIYDIYLYNNSEKEGKLFQGIEDTSSNPLYHSFKDLDLSELASGEYTCYTIRNDYGEAVKWQVSDVPLNSVLTYEGKEYFLKDLLPEVNLLKIGTENTKDNSTYRKTDVGYTYRKRRD